MKRTLWVDSCRFFAIFVIMFTHFLAEFFPEALRFWEEGASSWLLYGLTGKFSVAFFFVLLGYFASRRWTFSPGAFLRYGLRRYLHFAFFVLVCTVIYIVACYGCSWLFHSPGEAALRVISDGWGLNLSYLMRDALLFENNYNDTLWCLQQLFIASLVCRALGCLPRRMGLAAAVFVMAALLVMDAEYCVWICAALLGYLLRLVMERGVKPGTSGIAAAVITALVLMKIRMPECVLQYAMQALAAGLLIFAQFQLPAVQRLLEAKPFPWLGGISMGLFVVHTPINSVLACCFFPLLGGKIPGLLLWLTGFALSTGLSIFCAWLLHRMYGTVEKKVIRVPVKL